MLIIEVINRFNDLKNKLGKPIHRRGAEHTEAALRKDKRNELSFFSQRCLCVLRASAVSSPNRSEYNGRATSHDLEDKLQSPEQLPRIECRSEAQRVTSPEISILAPGQPHCAGSVIRICELRWERKPPSNTDTDRDDLVHCGEVCTIEQIRCIRSKLDPHWSILFEAERFAEPQVDAAVIRPQSGIAPDIEEAIGSTTCIPIDVG